VLAVAAGDGPYRSTGSADSTSGSHGADSAPAMATGASSPAASATVSAAAYPASQTTASSSQNGKGTTPASMTTVAKSAPAAGNNHAPHAAAGTTSSATSSATHTESALAGSAAPTVAGPSDTAQQAAPDAAKAPALVRLNVKPWASVLVDGASKGVSPPLKRLTLTDGKHQIRLVNPNFPDHVVDIMINDKRRFAAIEFDFAAK
jgi:hypothetical protein